jgi:hypothetical protein
MPVNFGDWRGPILRHNIRGVSGFHAEASNCAGRGRHDRLLYGVETSENCLGLPSRVLIGSFLDTHSLSGGRPVISARSKHLPVPNALRCGQFRIEHFELCFKREQLKVITCAMFRTVR